jgi:hypothetical protein
VVGINRGYLPIYRSQAILSICEGTAAQPAEWVYGVPTIFYRAPIGFRFIDMTGAQIFHDDPSLGQRGFPLRRDLFGLAECNKCCL